MSSSQFCSSEGESLNLKLIRQCVDVLRLITEQLRPAPPPAAVSAPATPPVAKTPVWEEADTFLATRTWQADPIVAMWVYPCYVYGLHRVRAMGGTLTGHRCLLSVTEAASEDQPHIETWLSDLAAHGLTADQLAAVEQPGSKSVFVRSIAQATASSRSAMERRARPQGAVLGSTDGIALDGHPAPVIDGMDPTLLAGSTAEDAP